MDNLVDVLAPQLAYIDHGDYIEFIEPVDGIVMVQKVCSGDLEWAQVEEYAKKLRLGGFDDWQVPLIDELSSLRNFLPKLLGKGSDLYWSSSFKVEYEATELQEYDVYFRLLMDSNSGGKKILYRIVESSYDEIAQCYSHAECEVKEEKCLGKVICVRVSEDKKLNREKGKEKDMWFQF